MKGFTDEKGHLCMFDKRRGKHSDHVVPQHVLYERDYETPTWAEMLKAIENCGMEGISLLRRGQYGALTSGILEGLLVYLIAHMNRSPHHFEELHARTPEDREVAFQTETAHRILNSGNVTFHPLEFRPSVVPLYLTDNPVSVLRVGEREAWITFPIASHLMISGISPSPEGEGNRLAWHSQPLRDSDDVAQKINNALFKRAARFVLCAEPITPPVGER